MGEDLGRTVSDSDLDSPGLKEEGLRELYRLMALTRRADLEATALQRQGELAVYPPLVGQEAAQVGSAFALEPIGLDLPLLPGAGRGGGARRGPGRVPALLPGDVARRHLRPDGASVRRS